MNKKTKTKWILGLFVSMIFLITLIISCDRNSDKPVQSFNPVAGQLMRDTITGTYYYGIDRPGSSESFVVLIDHVTVNDPEMMVYTMPKKDSVLLNIYARLTNATNEVLNIEDGVLYVIRGTDTLELNHSLTVDEGGEYSRAYTYLPNREEPQLYSWFIPNDTTARIEWQPGGFSSDQRFVIRGGKP